MGQDTVRAHTTYYLLSILAGTLLSILIPMIIALFTDKAKWMDVKDMLELLLPVETALIGSVVGFYFGTQSQIQAKK